MFARSPRPVLAALALLALLALGGCGASHSKVTTGTYAGESGKSAPYLDVGPLTYQIQVSRQLNPYDTEDSAYLQGLTPAQQKLEAGQEWFGVFIQVYNNSARARLAASAPTVVIFDAQDNLYVPVTLGPGNQFAYRGGLVPAAGRLPELDTVAANGATQGALLLYKIYTASLDNRPLKLRVVNPTNSTQTASAELDV
jgi:hypothetical protein